MTRWRWFWFGLVVPVLGAFDFWRETEDIKAGRTHTDGTTFSACVRWLVERIPGGRWALAASLGVLFGWFYTHVSDHLDNLPAEL